MNFVCELELIQTCLQFYPVFDHQDDDRRYDHGTDHVWYEEHVKVMPVKLPNGDVNASVAFD